MTSQSEIKPNPSAPRYEPELWNSRVSESDLRGFLKDNREIVARILAREEYRRPAEDFDIRMMQSKIDFNPVERTRDALVQFNKSVVRFEGDFDKIGAHFGMKPEDAKRFEPLARETYLAQGFQEYANCYSYAMNDMDRYRHGGDTPGERGDFGFSFASETNYETYKRELMKAVEADGAMIGGTDAEPIAGYYRVAVYARPPHEDPKVRGDNSLMAYHFGRENGDGTWSQKLGISPQAGSGIVTNLDDNGKVISDPRTAALGRYEFLSYVYVPEGGLDVGPPYEPKSKPGSIDLPLDPQQDWMRRTSDPYPETVSRSGLPRP